MCPPGKSFIKKVWRRLRMCLGIKGTFPVRSFIQVLHKGRFLILCVRSCIGIRLIQQIVCNPVGRVYFVALGYGIVNQCANVRCHAVGIVFLLVIGSVLLLVMGSPIWICTLPFHCVIPVMMLSRSFSVLFYRGCILIVRAIKSSRVFKKSHGSYS